MFVVRMKRFLIITANAHHYSYTEGPVLGNKKDT